MFQTQLNMIDCEIDTIDNNIKRRATGNNWRGTGEEAEEIPDLDYERGFQIMKHGAVPTWTQRGQEEYGINQQEMDIGAVWCHGERNESRK